MFNSVWALSSLTFSLYSHILWVLLPGHLPSLSCPENFYALSFLSSFQSIPRGLLAFLPNFFLAGVPCSWAWRRWSLEISQHFWAPLPSFCFSLHTGVQRVQSDGWCSRCVLYKLKEMVSCLVSAMLQHQQQEAYTGTLQRQVRPRRIGTQIPTLNLELVCTLKYILVSWFWHTFSLTILIL